MKYALLIFGLLFFAFDSSAQSMRSIRKDTIMMGSAFTFTAVHRDSKIAEEAVRAAIEEVGRIEKLISSWDESSRTAEINKLGVGNELQIEIELYDLIRRANKVAKITNGAFDITFASSYSIWDFNGEEQELPDSLLVSYSISSVDYNQIQLNPEGYKISFKKPDMQIGFGGIGKGYAANRAKKVMQSNGIKNGLVNAGGDLTHWGTNAYEKPWDIGIANPELKQLQKHLVLSRNTSIVTSGNYEKFFTNNDTRFGHILDPRTGWPANGLTSVSIICSDAEAGDAIATACYVMGLKEGMELINLLSGVEAIIIDNSGKSHFSKGIIIDE